jgi:hypothetical protein
VIRACTIALMLSVAPLMARAQAQRGAAELPPGFGSLRQDQITVALQSGDLLVKVTPLAESVIRLLAPDTYRRLHALAERYAKPDAPEPRALFAVEFFSYEQNVAFTPEDVRITHQARQLTAATIHPVTSGFGRQQLQQQQPQMAVYVFEAQFAYELPIIVHYGLQQSDEWTRILPRLEEERAKARARAGIGG